ncbi:MAG: hypothetical protein ABSC94_28340 [Polyangiaceae bacterium]|jgi:hypothetical protein
MRATTRRTVSAPLEGDTRGLLDPDALDLSFELRVRQLDANLGQVALGEIASARRSCISGRLRLIAWRRRRGVFRLVRWRGVVEHLLDGLRLGRELVEGELRVGDIVEALGFRGDQTSLEQVKLLEQLMVSDTQICERVLGLLELVAQRRVVVAQRRDLACHRNEALVVL